MSAIRRATPEDAPGIAAVRRAVWPGEAVDFAFMGRVIAEPDHATLVAVLNGTIAGFADGFLTLAADGTRRWEVDLLAVHPDYQRRGLGAALTAACTNAGRDFGPSLARALIRTDNLASRRAFARCGYQEGAACRLMINRDDGGGSVEAPAGSHIIPVMTLSYRGLWLEGVLTPAAFRAVQDIRARLGWAVAGAVIPAAQGRAIRAAEAAGFFAVGDYAWWERAL
jgi:GNAT superfamily N-acetyltransferase